VKPIASLSAEEARGLKGVLFDLDDTLLTHGKLSEGAYSALFRLQESGLLLFGVTGRPIAWGKLLVRQWPIEAAVCETGALCARLTAGRVTVDDSLTPALREHNRSRLMDLVREIRVRFKSLVVAADAAERVSDFTFDIGETQNTESALVDEVARFAEQRSARTNRSSVHLHITFDAHDKASGTLALLSRVYEHDPTAARKTFAYIGDSENDAPCFAAFHTSIGVGNLRGRHTQPPRFKAQHSLGAGFVEVAQHLVALRSG